MGACSGLVWFSVWLSAVCKSEWEAPRQAVSSKQSKRVLSHWPKTASGLTLKPVMKLGLVA